MLYDAIKTHRGRDEVVCTDELAKVIAYVRKMRRCQAKGVRRQRVSYRVVRSTAAVKYKKPPHYPNGRDH